ncbi:MAG: LytTR family DNA-binding domain-containing protein [Bacteroidota bacterium]
MNLPLLLETPFSRPKWSRRNVGLVLLTGLSCSLFIIFFRPFGIENKFDQWYFNLAILSMGVVFVSSYMLMEWGVPSLIPKPFQRWTVGKAIAWYGLVILLVGGAMFGYKSFLGGFRDVSLLNFFAVTARTLGIVTIVSFFSLGLFQYFSRKPINLFSNPQLIQLQPQSGPALAIVPTEILFVSSADNYVEVHYLENDVRKKAVLRASLKQIEAQLVNPLNSIRRCHRQHLINLDRFVIQHQTSRSLRLSLQEWEEEVPVSRQYVDEILARLSVHPK